MEKTYNELLVLFGIWAASFLAYLFLMFAARKDVRRYKNPSILKTILPISLASSVGIFAILKLCSFTMEQMGLHHFAYLFGIVAFPMAFIASIVFAMTFTESMRKPKHNQEETVEILDDTPLNKIAETIADKFPNVPRGRIRIFSKYGKPDTLCFLPYELTLQNHDDSFDTKVYPYSSLEQVMEISKTKDYEMKKTKLFFFNGELYISIDKQ